jgi:ArsR family metal-binding transcriptional regulator
MIFKSYTKEIFRPDCNPSFQSLHCIAHLEQDIAPALPYLNAVLGGFEYLQEPPSVTFKVHGKLITLHGRKIAINALKDEAEADRILEWLKREVNDAWDKRHDIRPSYEGMPRPKLPEILKLLPKTNCRDCGAPTCLVFATQVMEGVKGAEDCPPMLEENKRMLQDYISRFRFE